MKHATNLREQKLALRNEIVGTLQMAYEVQKSQTKKSKFIFNPFIKDRGTVIYNFNGLYAETNDHEGQVHFSDLDDEELIKIIEALENKLFEK